MKLALQNISLKFSHKSVLNNLSVEFEEGKIHALLGENGAGKSTTANIICGEIQPDSGSILIDNKIIKFKSPKDAIKNGICYVHQTPMLAENISVRENLLLGLNKKQKQNISEYAEKWITDIKLSTQVFNLGADKRFFVSLCSAFIKNPKILILDEPTALLDDKETEFLFTNLKEYAEKGLTVIIITHSFNDAKKYCNDTFFLQEGSIISDYLPEEFTVKFQPNKKAIQQSQINHTNCIQFRNLSCHPVNQPGISNLNFAIKESQITLIRGLPEDGLNTLEDLVTGMNTCSAEGIIISQNSKGEIIYNCNLHNEKFSTQILRHSIGFKTGIIPTNKKYRGSNPQLSVREILARDEASEGKALGFAKKIIELSQIDIKPEEKASALSGGMLQRLIYNREICTNPKFLILAQPFQGLDSAATANIALNIRNLADKGTMVLVLSSTPFPEEYCNKIYNLKNGKLEEVL